MKNYKNDKQEYIVYDIVVGLNHKRLVDFYKVSLEKEENHKYSYYKTEYLQTVAPNNIEEAILEYKSRGYHNILEFNFINYSFFCNNIFANLQLLFIQSKIKPLEFIYHTEIVNDMAKLCTSVIFIDMSTGKEFVVKTNDYGLETPKLCMELEKLGYKHISETTLIEHPDKVNKKMILELTKK